MTHNEKCASSTSFQFHGNSSAVLGLWSHLIHILPVCPMQGCQRYSLQLEYGLWSPIIWPPVLAGVLVWIHMPLCYVPDWPLMLHRKCKTSLVHFGSSAWERSGAHNASCTLGQSRKHAATVLWLSPRSILPAALWVSWGHTLLAVLQASSGQTLPEGLACAA